MVEKIKLGIWDFFAYVLSGAAVIISVLVHCLCIGTMKLDDLNKTPSVVIATLSLLLILLIGLLLEPIANLIDKVFALGKSFLTILFWRKEAWNKFKSDFSQSLSEFGFKKWDINIKKLEEKAKKTIKKDIHENIFQYCKNWVIQNANAEQFHSSLGKYGLYRNLFLICLGNSIFCFYLYPREKAVISFVVIFSFGLLYLYRSRIFYRHMSNSIYNQFLVTNKKKIP